MRTFTAQAAPHALACYHASGHRQVSVIGDVSMVIDGNVVWPDIYVMFAGTHRSFL
jgi:hypothetical protein